MAYLIVRHQVENFDKWKPLYDEHGAVRKQSGCKNEQLLRDSEDPNDLFILFEWDSIENARRFMQSEDLKQAMQNAGVIGTPEFHFLELVERKVTGESFNKKIA